MSFIRTSIATPLGTALLNRWMRKLVQGNIGQLSQNMDQVREWMPHVSLTDLYGQVVLQTTLTSLKELFGWVCIGGTVFVLLLIGYRFWRDGRRALLE